MGDAAKSAKLPPRWFIRSFWTAHRFVVRATGARLGLWRPRRGRWGTMRLTTVGRRTGRERQVVIAYLEDGPNLTALAMNGWAGPEPDWWLNLQAQPVAHVDLPDGRRWVRAHAVQGEERDRLWRRWAEVDDGLDAYAALRPRPTAVVLFEPADQA